MLTVERFGSADQPVSHRGHGLFAANVNRQVAVGQRLHGGDSFKRTGGAQGVAGGTFDGADAKRGTLAKDAVKGAALSFIAGRGASAVGVDVGDVGG